MNLPTQTELDSLPSFTENSPIRVLVSACLMGTPCGVDGTSYGDFPWVRKLMALPNVKAVPFCPEDFAFGTPRQMPDIHGGNGFDVLDGKARVISDRGEDWTDKMVLAAREMLRHAAKNQVHLAILTDMSAACGTQVISDGCRLAADRKYQKGPGVAAALLIRNGIKVIAQRDFRTLEYLHRKIDPAHPIDGTAMDHHETEWYRTYFISPTLYPRLTTDRLVLRQWRNEDRVPFGEMNADPRVMEYFPSVLTRAESDAMVDRIEKHFDENGFTFWALEAPGVAPFVGFVGLARTPYQTPFTPCVEIGWRLAFAHWGKGYASEAAHRALQCGFQEMGLSEIVAFTATGNIRSRRVMEKLGMTRKPEDDFDHPRVPEGNPLRPHVLYRLPSSRFR